MKEHSVLCEISRADVKQPKMWLLYKDENGELADSQPSISFCRDIHNTPYLCYYGFLCEIIRDSFRVDEDPVETNGIRIWK